MDQMAVNVDERRLSRRLRDKVGFPDFFEHGAWWHLKFHYTLEDFEIQSDIKYNSLDSACIQPTFYGKLEKL